MTIRIFLIAASLTLATSGFAQDGPKVQYSADSVFETADSVQQGRVYYAPGMERREYVEDGQNMVMIIRNDKKKVLMLMPDDKMYMEMAMPKGGRKDDISGYKMEGSVVGQEKMNGVETTKKKMIMTAPDGSKMGGFSWVSKEGITVKLDAIAVDKTSKERIKQELSNIQVGKQDPSLFEIPKGYTNMAMGGMSDMMKVDDDDDNGEPGNEPQPEEPKKKKKFSIKNPLKFLKE